MMQWDEKLFYAIYDLAHRSAAADFAAVWANKFSIPVFGLALLWYFFRNRRVFWTGAWAAVLSRGILTPLIRFVYHRPRPFVALPDIHILVNQNPAEASFPSGHAAFLFAIAFAVWLYNKKIGGIFIVAALLTTFARIYAGVHYPVDILGGILVAAISVFVIYKLKHK